MRTVVRWTFLVLLLLAAGGAVWLLIYGGRYLQYEDPLVKADAIFVLGGSRLERPLEAVELYKAGHAPLVLLSPGRPEPSEYLARQLGIKFPLESELQRDAIIQLGVPATAVTAMDGYADNTAQEAALLRTMVERTHWRRVIVVTSKYHTRRAAFAFRRALAGTGAEVIMRASRYDPSDPRQWWRTRPGFRFATSEFQKLIAYRLGLGE